MSYQSVHLTNLSAGAEATRRATRLRQLLDGQTYMGLRVIAAPYMGNLVVSVQGEAETKEELQGMINMVLAEELMKRL